MPDQHPVHTFSDDALGDSDCVELAMRIRKRDVHPREVIAASIQRAEQLSHTMPAYRSENFDQAMQRAESASPEDNALFSGLPTFIKDNLPTQAFATGFGSAAVTPGIEKRHDPYAKQFNELGFNVLGKSSLPEFGFNATTEPAHEEATRNPWNPGFSAGASSGGAAALVASGVVPIAHGNDGGGSIRIPAACCGLVGLKPSRGRHVNSLAARALPINLVSEGVLTRSVRDTAYFHYLAETHYQNPKLPRLPLIVSPGKRQLKIALLTQSVTGQPTDAPNLKTLEHTAHLLADMGHTIEPIEMPVSKHFAQDFPLYWAMMAFMVTHTGRLAFGGGFDKERLDGLSKGLSQFYRKKMLRTPMALYRLRREAHQYLNTFEHFDLILSPVLSRCTAPLEYLSPEVPFDLLFERLRAYVGFTPLANVAGSPAISLPMGFCPDGLPLGIQLSANLGREDLLLETAYALEEAKPWPTLASYNFN